MLKKTLDKILKNAGENITLEELIKTGTQVYLKIQAFLVLRISTHLICYFFLLTGLQIWTTTALEASSLNLAWQEPAIDSVSADSVGIDSLQTVVVDTASNLPYEPSKLPTFEPKDRFGDPFSNNTSPSSLLLKDPASLKLDLEIDTGMNYTIYEKIGDINYRPTSSMSFDEFSQYQEDRIIKDYWKTRSLGLDGESAVSGRRLIPPIFISPVFDRIFWR